VLTIVNRDGDSQCCASRFGRQSFWPWCRGFAYVDPFVTGCWIPLAVWITLQPDFGTKLSGGLQQTVGTIIGVVIAFVTVEMFDGEPDTMSIFLTIFAVLIGGLGRLRDSLMVTANPPAVILMLSLAQPVRAAEAACTYERQLAEGGKQINELHWNLHMTELQRSETGPALQRTLAEPTQHEINLILSMKFCAWIRLLVDDTN
jgi:hypothetical protein